GYRGLDGVARSCSVFLCICCRRAPSQHPNGNALARQPIVISFIVVFGALVMVVTVAAAVMLFVVTLAAFVGLIVRETVYLPRRVVLTSGNNALDPATEIGAARGRRSLG